MRPTAFTVGVAAGVLFGLLVPLFRPRDPIAEERVQAAAELLSDCTRRMVAYAGQAHDCREELTAARRQADVLDALAGAGR